MSDMPSPPANVPGTNEDVIAIFRANGGQVPAPYDNPPPMLLLHTIGRRSGREHVVPMRSLETANGLYVFASAHGSATHPDWYHNVRAHPEILLEKGTEAYAVRAVELEGDERDAIFARHAARFPFFVDYEAKTGRRIPVLRLDRVESPE